MARTFAPKEHQGGDEGQYLEVAGEYLLVGTSIKRDSSRNKKDFLLYRFEVIHGPMKGRSFRERIYINDEALWKMGRMCEAMDQEDVFDLDSNREVWEATCNRPFKARVKIKSDPSNASKKYAEVDSFYKRVTDAEVNVMNAWTAEAEAAKSMDGNSGSEYGGGGNSSDFNDDDIPF